MIKVVSLLKKRAGITSTEFRDYYENQHLKLFESYINDPKLGSYVARHVRRYLTPIADPTTGHQHEDSFDVILEIWFKSKEAYKSFFEGAPDVDFRKIVAEDEEKLFDRSQMYYFTADECDTEIRGLTAD